MTQRGRAAGSHRERIIAWRWPVAGLAVISLIGGLTCQGAIYRWQDSAGRIHYSDRPHLQAEPIQVNPGYEYYTVTRVYDGDTVQLSDDRRVRLLGLNTPEVAYRHQDGQAGGATAKAWLGKRLAGVRVRLVLDQQRRDDYGRTLAHLFTEQGEHINRELLAEGLATVNLHPPNLAYAEELIQAGAAAERRRLGLWQLPEYQPRPITGVTAEAYRGWQRLQGRVVALRETRKSIYLIFSDRFRGRIEKRYLGLFPDPAQYTGRRVELRGWVSRSGEDFTMRLRHPSAILLLPE